MNAFSSAPATFSSTDTLSGVVAWSGLPIIVIGIVAMALLPGFKRRLSPEDIDEIDGQQRYARRIGSFLIILGLALSGTAVLFGSNWTTTADGVALPCVVGFSFIWSLTVAWFFPGALFRKFRTRTPKDLEVPTPFDPDSEKGQLELYKIAVDTRKLELDLFWKRSGFFWGFLAVTLAGYFTAKQNGQTFAQLLLAQIGVLEALCWWLVNRGSKYWHENWEQMVRKLEKAHGLFNQTAKLQRKGSLGAAAYSVSRITIFFSLCTLVLFVGLALNEVIRLFLQTPSTFLAVGGPVMLSISTATGFLFVWLDGVSGSAGGDPDHSMPDNEQTATANTNLGAAALVQSNTMAITDSGGASGSAPSGKPHLSVKPKKGKR